MLDAKLLAAKWYLGELSGEDMPGIACQALELGHDGKNLRYLAGLSGPARRDILEIVDGAMHGVEKAKHQIVEAARILFSSPT